ncbi:hypothetical protein [Novipirellula caenicola]|uniref:hypothetical protein n=1 Tax=Novipirellula caenicola TaxID=1536901 RepID=UPI0031EC436F
MFDPIYAMVKVFAGNRIIAHQEAAANGPTTDVGDRNFVEIEDFPAGQEPSSTSPKLKEPATSLKGIFPSAN